MDYEVMFQTIGTACCLLASVYLIYRGLFVIGSLFLLAFVAQLQLQAYLHFFMEIPADVGVCLLETVDYYDCLPWGQKLSIHLAQLSYYLIALAMVLMARTTKNTDKPNPLARSAK